MKLTRAVAALGMAASVAFGSAAAIAQDKQIKIGIIFDQTGAFAGGGSLPAYYGTKFAIDIMNERGGVEGYKIVPVFADAQSKADVAVT